MILRIKGVVDGGEDDIDGAVDNRVDNVHQADGHRSEEGVD